MVLAPERTNNLVQLCCEKTAAQWRHKGRGVHGFSIVPSLLGAQCTWVNSAKDFVSETILWLVEEQFGQLKGDSCTMQESVVMSREEVLT